MRLSLALVLFSLTAFAKAPVKKPVVLTQSPPALLKLMNKELGKKYQFIALKKPLGDAPTAKEVRNVTVPARASAVMIIVASKKFVTMQILNGSDGTPLDTVTVKTLPKKPLKKLSKDALKSISNALASGVIPRKEVVEELATGTKTESTTEAKIEKAEVKAQKTVEPVKEDRMATAKAAFDEKQKPVEEVQVESSSSESTPSEQPALTALRMGLAFKGINRSFNWSGGGDTLAAYSLGFAPAISVDATWFPAAHFTNSFAGNIGLYGSADIVVGLSSSQENAEGTGKSYFGTTANRMRLGGVVRFQVDKHEISAHGGYSTQTFAIAPVAANDGAPRPNIPSVNFTGPRFGAGGRINFEKVTLDLGAAFQIASGKGELGTDKYFPNATAFGLDATAGLSLEVVKNIHARLGFDFTRYFLTLNPTEGQALAANGAGDQYISGSLGLLWNM